MSNAAWGIACNAAEGSPEFRPGARASIIEHEGERLAGAAQVHVLIQSRGKGRVRMWVKVELLHNFRPEYVANNARAGRLCFPTKDEATEHSRYLSNVQEYACRESA